LFDLDAAVVGVSINVFSGCAALADGTVACFGADQYGSLGGRAGPGPVPVSLPQPATAVGVASSGVFGCSRLREQHVMCWGLNSGLGRGIAGGQSPPGLVLLEDGGALAGVTELGAGAEFACARVASGDVYCWGMNDFGQLGDPTSSGLFAHRVPLP
jgi:hypothetical protein